MVRPISRLLFGRLSRSRSRGPIALAVGLTFVPRIGAFFRFGRRISSRLRRVRQAGSMVGSLGLGRISRLGLSFFLQVFLDPFEHFAVVFRRRILRRFPFVRGIGTPDLLVATGRAEIMLDPVMAVWDCGPFPPIFREAGGYFGDWSGHEGRIDGGEALATNAALRDEVVALLRD